jgi:hypothetical protein
MRALIWLKIVDAHDGQLSLTNVALYIVLVKLALAQDVNVVDAGSLLIALASYQGKKLMHKRVAPTDTSLKDRLDELASKVNAQQVALGIKEMRR